MGARRVLDLTAARLGLSHSLVAFPGPGAGPPPDPDGSWHLETPFAGETIPWGRVDAACGRAAAVALDAGIRAAATGQTRALVTAPISKAAWRAAGIPFPGHTEFLQDRTGVPAVAMAFTSPTLRVVLLTGHCPLTDVPARLRTLDLPARLAMIDRELTRRFGARPRLALAGVNPHAGEGGLFGPEEGELLVPAVAAAREAGLQIHGPCAPDTVYHRAVQGEFDWVIAPYHDQGLAPLKTLHFREAVQITLGLPFLRASVDHGTAFDIAGTGAADPTNLIQALSQAAARTGREAGADAGEAATSR